MAELSLTKWMDPAFTYFANQMGIPVAEFSSQVGGEGIGNALELMADMFTKGWLNKGIQSVAGLIANSYAIWGTGVPKRLRVELLAMGTHELLRILDPSPKDVIEARQSLETFISAAQRGDWNLALSSVLTTPAEFQAMFGMRRVTPTPTPTPPRTPTPGQLIAQDGHLVVEIPRSIVPKGRYGITVEEPLPHSTSPKGRYMVTG